MKPIDGASIPGFFLGIPLPLVVIFAICCSCCYPYTPISRF